MSATIILQAFIIISVVATTVVTALGYLKGGSAECWCGMLATHPGGECRDHSEGGE